MKNPTINVKRFLKAIKVGEDVTAQRGLGIAKPKKATFTTQALAA